MKRFISGLLSLFLFFSVSACNSKAYQDGYAAGYSAGYDSGYDNGYDSGYESGNNSGSSYNNDNNHQTFSEWTAQNSSNNANQNDNQTTNDEQKNDDSQTLTVYITKTGEKYHLDGCSYLKSRIPISLADANSLGYTPCSRCDPPS